jgi:hypothetical protein
MPDHGFASIGYGLPSGWLCPALSLAVVASSGDVVFNKNLGGLEIARQAGCGLNPRNT